MLSPGGRRRVEEHAESHKLDTVRLLLRSEKRQTTMHCDSRAFRHYTKPGADGTEGDSNLREAARPAKYIYFFGC